MADITLTVHENEQIRLAYVEAKIKPEQAKSVTPGYEPQVVFPDAGMTLNRVDVAAFPEPTDSLAITGNGSYDVARIGTADVNVPQGVFPSGTLALTANGIFSVEQYANVSINVPEIIGGNYAVVKKIRITYDGNDLVDAQYIAVLKEIQKRIPNYFMVFGFEVISAPIAENDFVAAYYGSDVYGFRVYRWYWDGTKIVRKFENYSQNAKGNLRNGAVVDVLYSEKVA
jgi:hypothetical protein